LDLLYLVGFAALAAIVALRLIALARGGAAPIAVSGIAALGLAAVASIGHGGGLAQLSLALAAASAGSLVWAWPLAKAPFGPLALIVLVAALASLALAETHGALHTPWALLVLPMAFWADRIAERLPGLAKLAKKKQTRPVALALGAALPTLASISLAMILAGRDLHL
jgi:hypothetical protein